MRDIYLFLEESRKVKESSYSRAESMVHQKLLGNADEKNRNFF